MEITPEMHNAIIVAGKKIWKELRDGCNERDVVGELKETTISIDGKTYDLAIDCYWEKANYFDYHVKGHGIDCRRFVACYM